MLAVFFKVEDNEFQYLGATLLILNYQGRLHGYPDCAWMGSGSHKAKHLDRASIAKRQKAQPTNQPTIKH